VALALVAYGTAASYVDKYKLTVYYQPQIEFDRWLGNGTLPTVWLQQHLYHGHPGVLESVCVVFYASHFAIPLALGLLLALLNRSSDFKFLMFGILAVSVLGAITFLVAPTAPPWLANRDGYVTGVHELLKQGLDHMHLSALAQLVGDPTKYDVTAAAPSLHTAYPLICIIAAARARLPKIVISALVINLFGVVFAIVYMGEHYVFDVLVGTAYAVVAVAIVRKAMATGTPSTASAPAPATRTALSRVTL
jgi:membrane-associated phospholipid phosphatase